MATWEIAALEGLREVVYEQVGADSRDLFQKRPGSRRSVFESEEDRLVRPLPVVRYKISEWVCGRRVARNGHIAWAKNHHLIPYTHVGEKANVRITARMVEIYRGQERLSSHVHP